MNKESFYQVLTENGLILSDVQKRQLHTYFKMLVEKNKVMNLTGITEENEVYEKHFYDSLLFTFNGDNPFALGGKSLLLAQLLHQE